MKLDNGLNPSSMVANEIQPTLFPETLQSERANTSAGISSSSLFEISIPFKFGKAFVGLIKSLDFYKYNL